MVTRRKAKQGGKRVNSKCINSSIKTFKRLLSFAFKDVI